MTEANINEKYDNDSMSFKLKGICQSSYKITGKIEDEALDIAFKNYSQDANVILGYQDICNLCDRMLGHQEIISASVKSQNILS